jgi:MraZ protein
MDEVFYFGMYEHSLDSQGRVAIPSDWRQGEGDSRFILFQGEERDLLLFPFESFRSFLIKAQKVSFANPAAQHALQKFGSRARECRCDKQGRIRIEKGHLDAVGIADQVSMIGGVTHIKLCAPQNWNADDGGGISLAEVEKINDGGGDIMSQLLNHLSNGK